MSTLLVIDDEEPILHFFRRAFHGPEITLVTAKSAAEGFERVTLDRPDVVILDIDLPDQSGLECFAESISSLPRVPVIFITGHGTTATAIEAMSLGAYEYLLKPLELDPLSELVARAFEVSRLMRVPAVVLDGEGQAEDAAGPARWPVRRHAGGLQAIGRVAPQDVTVLILGETGTGKEVVARAIYHYSRRPPGRSWRSTAPPSPRPCWKASCSATREAPSRAPIAGGSASSSNATGARCSLDEIGDMTPLTQAKILRVLQEQQFERVGGSETIATDVRVIAATNRDLERVDRRRPVPE